MINTLSKGINILSGTVWYIIPLLKFYNKYFFNFYNLANVRVRTAKAFFHIHLHSKQKIQRGIENYPVICEAVDLSDLR